VSRPIPDYPYDIFTHDAVRQARAVDDSLREHAPVVRLPDGTVMLARHEHVAKGLMDWKSFSSTSRPWHDPASLRPEILLTDDPPAHTRVRTVIGAALSPRVLDQMRERFVAEANALVAELKARDGEIIDAVGEITQRFVFKVLPDALGLPDEGREHMHGFSNMVWATMGPPNALFDEAMVEDFSPVIAWLDRTCGRDALDPGGIGVLLFDAADRGQISQAEAKLLLQTVLSAGADTTYITMANALQAWSLFPDEYAKVRADPKLIRNAFDESLRWDSPSRMAGRITAQDVAIDDSCHPRGHALRADVRRRQPRPALLGCARRVSRRPRP
jgi:cytochrome P450